MKRGHRAGFTLIGHDRGCDSGYPGGSRNSSIHEVCASARTSEAVMNIEKIEKGARVYYMAETNFRNRLGDRSSPVSGEGWWV